MLKAAPHRKSDDKTLEEKCEQLQKKNSQLEQKLKVEVSLLLCIVTSLCGVWDNW